MIKRKRGQRIRNFFCTLSSLRLRMNRVQALFALSNSTPLLASAAMSLSSWCEQSEAVDQVESFMSAGIFSNQSEPQCFSIMWMSRLRGDSVPITAPARTYRTPPRVLRSASRESTAGLGCSVPRRLACTWRTTRGKMVETSSVPSASSSKIEDAACTRVIPFPGFRRRESRERLGSLFRYRRDSAASTSSIGSVHKWARDPPVGACDELAVCDGSSRVDAGRHETMFRSMFVQDGGLLTPRDWTYGCRRKRTRDGHNQCNSQSGSNALIN
jgi:hypothetical protein